MKQVRSLRVAVAGVGHYHAAYSPVYLELIKQHGGELVAVADSDVTLAEERARRFGGVAYGDFRHMIAEQRPDFVLGLGRERGRDGEQQGEELRPAQGAAPST